MSTAVTFGIEAASYFMPGQRRDLAQWASAHEIPQTITSALLANGMRHYYASDATVEDLAVEAVADLMRRRSVARDEIDVLIYVHALQTSVPPPPASLAARLKAKFGLRNACCFSIAQQNCASVLVAMRIAHSLFATDEAMRKVLLVTSDRCCGEAYRNVAVFSFQSDGASALLLSRNTVHNRVASVVTYADGEHHAGYRRSPELITRYRSMYGAIATRLIRQAVQRSGLPLQAFRFLIPINMDRNIFISLAGSLRMDPAWVFTRNIADKAHVMCSDVAVNVLDLWDSGQLEAGDNVVFYMSGNSGSFAAMTLVNCSFER